MTDFLDEKRQEIQSRMAELRPLIDEYQRLEAAASALEGVGGAASTAVAAPARRGPGRPPGSGRKPGRPKGSGSGRKPGRPKGSGRGPGRPRKAVAETPSAETAAASATTATATKKAPAKRGRPPGRRKGSGTRAAQALAIVSEQPGVTIPELAARMGIKQNYLYRVLPGLEQEKKVAKQGRGWHPGSKA